MTKTMEIQRAAMPALGRGFLAGIPGNPDSLKGGVIPVLDAPRNEGSFSRFLVPEDEPVKPGIPASQIPKFRKDGFGYRHDAGTLAFRGFHSVHFIPGMTNEKVVVHNVLLAEGLDLAKPEPGHKGEGKGEASAFVGPIEGKEGFDLLRVEDTLFGGFSAERTDGGSRVSGDDPETVGFLEADGDGLEDVVEGLRVQPTLVLQAHEPAFELARGDLGELQLSQGGIEVPDHPALAGSAVGSAKGIALSGESSLDVRAGIPVPELGEVVARLPVSEAPGGDEPAFDGFGGHGAGTGRACDVPFVGIEIHSDCDLAYGYAGTIGSFFGIPKLNVKGALSAVGNAAAVQGKGSMPHERYLVSPSDILSDSGISEAFRAWEIKKANPYTIRICLSPRKKT